MPLDGAIIFGDLSGKLDVLEVVCDKCGRKGRYAVMRKKQSGNMSDQCAARRPDLSRVI